MVATVNTSNYYIKKPDELANIIVPSHSRRTARLHRAYTGPMQAGVRSMRSLHNGATAMADQCFATLFFNDTTVHTRRRPFALDASMARLWVARMLSLTKLPIYVMHNEENAAGLVLAPHQRRAKTQLRLVRVPLVVVDTRGTMPWYRLTHTKLHAWALPCKRVALIDYDGVPLRNMDAIFDACDAPLCGVMDRHTPFASSKRSHYMNSGVLLLTPNQTYHSWLMQQAKSDATRSRGRYYAEQGFFHERSIPWARLPDGFNVQMRYGRSNWRPRNGQDVNDTDFYLHKKVYELPFGLQRALNLTGCVQSQILDDAGLRTAAVQHVCSGCACTSSQAKCCH